MYWAPRQVHSIWGAQSIFITENGCAAAHGIPVHGYFHWSAQDNLEWSDGFSNRFGLTYLDFNTRQRTPKLSAHWFCEAATRNTVV
jgi:beta-glucosidase